MEEERRWETENVKWEMEDDSSEYWSDLSD
jgi:hypothetical protein